MKRAELVTGKTYAIVKGEGGLHTAWIAEVVDTAATYRRDTSYRRERNYYKTTLYPDHNAVLVRSSGGGESLVRLMDIRQEWTQEELDTYCEQRRERQQRESQAWREDSEKRDELMKLFRQLAPELGIEGYVEHVSSNYGSVYQRDLKLKTHQLEQLVKVLFQAAGRSV